MVTLYGDPVPLTPLLSNYLHSGLNYGLPKSRLSSPLVELHWREPNQDSSQEKKEGLKSEYIFIFLTTSKRFCLRKGRYDYLVQPHYNMQRKGLQVKFHAIPYCYTGKGTSRASRALHCKKKSVQCTPNMVCYVCPNWNTLYGVKSHHILGVCLTPKWVCFHTNSVCFPTNFSVFSHSL